MSESNPIFDHEKWDTVGMPKPEPEKKAKRPTIRRLKSEAVNNCRMVALIAPAGQIALPSQLDMNWPLKKSEERIQEITDSEDFSPKKEESVDDRQIGKGVVPSAINKAKTESPLTRRRGSAAACTRSQRKIFDMVFEPVMQMINDELEAKKKTEEGKTDPTLIDKDGSDPSKMTSPEKKLFKDKLFQRCDTITEKTNFVLVNCEAVKQKVSNTISENKKVMKVYEDAQKEFNDRMEEIVEANVRSQANKYKNCKDYVEPNLKKRFEMKRERARIKA